MDVPSEPGLRRTATVQHLHTPFRGTTDRRRHVLELVARLHPTPATAGLPRATSMALIRQHEGFDRGWYAGPVGWLDARGDGEFAVALRSALVRDNTALLYAGCGIVAGSDPEREYVEAGAKLRSDAGCADVVNAHADGLATYLGAFADALAGAGVEHLCLCPGSRSTPLALTFARQGKLRLWMHLDERSCAYFALGLAKATRKPVALLCTSGTAAVNFAPAVVEASQGRVPLIVLTADRPPELRDLGANQTIDQSRGLYGTATSGLPRC